ncbi:MULTISPECIES: helix-turn-helix domain-containing protein [Sporosarcina]|uniref:Transcriptional regulator, contains XRE-family HTH domain n=1 Tax=Sporosarcina newyorkensis TaxID=759851 RepID=A0A1T4YTV7_9BACL|nr:helix-turn-helix transcriptional regulator [Sporosarcina newyorkensis]SKB05264.1 Transcriptional regulator, contains XRE-family HTH domain [Sporosarcina newyorkensis]
MLGPRLKKLRTTKKLTQKQLAEKINVTNVSVSGYESGNRFPDTDTLQRLADYFEVTTDYLLGRSDNSHMTADEEFQSFSNNPKLEHFFKDIEASDEQEQEELQQIWEIIKQRKRNEDK